MKAHNVADLARQAKARLPHGIWEFIERGTEDELCLAHNSERLRALKLRPRVLVGVSERRLGGEVLGAPSALPFGIAPTGAAGLTWYQGELEVAKAAAKAGVPFCLATGAMTSIEQIGEEAGGRLWFQLYLWTDREASLALIDRVDRARFEALVLTVDAQVSPNREYNLRNGFSLPFRVTPRNALDIVRRPQWMTGVIGRYLAHGGMPKYVNYPASLQTPITGAPPIGAGLANHSLTWDELKEIRRRWRRKLIVKGVLHPDDAVRAVELGADAVVVSNHGGRNLDAVMASIDALPQVAEAVNGRAEVIFDGGVRRGSDVFKALACGADFVLVGRAALYGVAANGQAGVLQSLDFLRQELDRTMAFCGCRSIDDIGRDLLAPAPPGSQA